MTVKGVKGVGRPLKQLDPGVIVAVSGRPGTSGDVQGGKWTRIYRTCTSKSKGGVTERFELLDAIGRSVKYCLRILHPPTRLPSTPSARPLAGPTFEHHLTAEDPPSETKPEVKRRRVYFTLTLPPLRPPGPLPLHFSYRTCPRVVPYPLPSSPRFHNVSRVGFSGTPRISQTSF